MPADRRESPRHEDKFPAKIGSSGDDRARRQPAPSGGECKSLLEEDVSRFLICLYEHRRL